MRITFVLPTVDYSGGTRVVASHAHRLRERGHDVTCVSVVNRGVPFKQRVKSVITGRGWPTYPSRPASHLDTVGVPHAGVREQIPELRVISFGMRSPAESLPLPAGTDFVQRPAQDRIRELYAQCDVWLCGSRSEGFGLPVLEAMACRCPVVSTKVGGPI